MRKKYVLITGATSGIGKATSLKFLDEGYISFLTGRNGYELENIHKKYKKNCFIFQSDLRKEKERRNLCEFIFSKTNYLNVLVNAAGIIKIASIEKTNLKEFKEMMEINLHAPFHLIKLLLPLIKNAKGSIINVSSVTGKRAFANALSYCTSKAGLDQLTRCLSLELAPFGIRVNAINLGVVITNLHKRGGMNEEDYQKFLEHSKTTHPLGRVGNPEEIAELIYFLSSDKASWITGETISIDGGRSQTSLEVKLHLTSIIFLCYIVKNFTRLRDLKKGVSFLGA